MVEQQRPEVWDVLEEVIREHPVLLNRADAASARHPGVRAGAGRGQGDPDPSAGLHRVQRGLRRRPDGGPHPARPEAQIEASVLMMSSNNILSPASGAPIAMPSQDIVLGCYYLTKARAGAKGEGRVFGNTDDVVLALEAGELETLTPIRLRYSGQILDLTTRATIRRCSTPSHGRQEQDHQHDRRPRAVQRPRCPR